MSTRRRKQQGFTLVEILIVVVILGILAAIVIPQFTSARRISAGQQLDYTAAVDPEASLSWLRSSTAGLILTWSRINGPPMTTETEPVAAYTAADVPATGDEVGPYLQQPPINPFTNSATVVAAGSAAATNGWTYNATTGVILASVLTTKASELNLDTTNDVETYAAAP